MAARTIRPKITKQLPKYLTDFPEVRQQTRKWTAAPPSKIEWEQVLKTKIYQCQKKFYQWGLKCMGPKLLMYAALSD